MQTIHFTYAVTQGNGTGHTETQKKEEMCQQISQVTKKLTAVRFRDQCAVQWFKANKYPPPPKMINHYKHE